MRIALYILMIVSLVSCQKGNTRKSPKAIKGVLDLRSLPDGKKGWNFSEDGVVNLQGEWEFYWMEFLEPGNPEIEKNISPEQKKYINKPGVWNNFQVDGKPIGSTGFTTYRLTVLLPSAEESKRNTLAIRLSTASSAFRFYVDGKLLTEVGKIGKSAEEANPEFRPHIIVLPDLKDSVEFVFHVSNYSHDKGGLWGFTWFGTIQDLQRMRENSISLDLFIFGALFLMGFYHLGLFLLRTKDSTTLLFGLFCLFISIRSLMTGEKIWVQLFPGFSWFLAIKIEYLILYLGVPIIIEFVAKVFPSEIPNWLRKGIILSPLLLSLTIILFEPIVFTKYLPFMHVVIVIALLTSIYTLSLAVYRKRFGAITFVFGFFVFTITIVNDLLFSNGVIRTGHFAPFGFLFFVFSQAFFLSKRFTNAFTQVETLSQSMESQNRKLEEQNHKLQDLDRQKDEFLANTSHELRTPLNGIIGLAESLVDGVAGEQSKEAKANLNLIISSGRRLSNLINDILDFSKLKHKELQVNLQPVDIYSITNLVIQLSEPLVKKKNLKLINQIPESTTAVLADENRLQQILHNVIGNAIKFTEEGSVTVSANLKENSQVLEIQIADTGIGIPKDKLEKVFESFEQVDASNTRKYGGTGLGLSVTKQLVELQGGNIWVESELGKGSKFYFTIPVTDSMPHKIEKSTMTPIHQSLEEGNAIEENESKTKANAHILVVDYEPVNLQVISNHFSLRGYKVTTMVGGKEALEYLEKEKPDLVLLDVMMPNMTGFEVCEKIREKYDMNQLPVLFLTAKNNASDLLEGFEAEGNDYVVKPFSKVELLSRVETHIKLKDKTNEIALVSKVKDEFLSNLSHEIKTPLSVIYAYAEMLNNGKDFPDKIKKYSNKIYDSAQKLNEYVSDLILISDIESNLQLQNSDLDSVELINRVVNTYKPLMAEKEINLKLNLPNKMNLSGDSILLEKAISAVMKNAIVYNKSGGSIEISIGQSSLRLRSGSESAGIQIQITDTGIGIAKEHQEKVFEKFFRVDSSLTYEVSGVGVGLFIARKIIELHNGKIVLESEIEKGTTVLIQIPISESNEK